MEFNKVRNPPRIILPLNPKLIPSPDSPATLSGAIDVIVVEQENGNGFRGAPIKVLLEEIKY